MPSTKSTSRRIVEMRMSLRRTVEAYHFALGKLLCVTTWFVPPVLFPFVFYPLGDVLTLQDAAYMLAGTGIWSSVINRFEAEKSLHRDILSVLPG